jgi:hypothetical protein
MDPMFISQPLANYSKFERIIERHVARVLAASRGTPPSRAKKKFRQADKPNVVEDENFAISRGAVRPTAASKDTLVANF